MVTLPDVSEISDFVDQLIEYDSLVKPSIEEGYMTRDQFIITTYINYFCNSNAPSADDSEKEERLWKSTLPKAYEAAVEQFGITVGQAEELFTKSLDIRSRNIKE